MLNEKTFFLQVFSERPIFRKIDFKAFETKIEPPISGWEFTKLLTQIRKIFLNFKVILQSSYLYKISTL